MTMGEGFYMRKAMVKNKIKRCDWRTSNKKSNIPASKKEHPLFFITAIMPEYDVLYKIVYDECKRILEANTDATFVINKVVTGGVDPLLLECHIENVFRSQRKPHALLTIGVSATKAAKRYTSEKNCRVPIVFSGVDKTAVSELVHSKTNSRNNLVGVASLTPCHFLPIQLLQLANPNIKTILVPYHEKACDQMVENIDKAKVFFKGEGSTVDKFCFSERKLPPELFEKMKEYDAVVIPEGGTSFRDRDTIINFCNQAGIPVHADGKEAIRRGALFAVTADVKYIAKQAAEKLKAVTISKKKPAELTTTIMTNMKKTLYGGGGSGQLGIVFQENDYGIVFESCTKTNAAALPSRFATRKQFVAYCESNLIGIQESIEVLTQHVSSDMVLHVKPEEEGLFTVYDLLQEKGELYNSRFPLRSIRPLLSKNTFPSFFVSGGTALANLISEMKISDQLGPITSVQFASSVEDAIGLKESLEYGLRHEATILEPVDPMWVLSYLKSIGRSGLKAAYLLYGEQGQKKKNQFDAYLERCCQAARSLSFELRPVHVASAYEVERVMRAHKGKRNAFLSMAHLIDDPLAREMVLMGRKLNLLILAPSTAYTHVAPLSIGMEQGVLRHEGIPVEKYNSTLLVRKIPAMDLYVRYANEELLSLMGYEKELQELIVKSGKIFTK